MESSSSNEITVIPPLEKLYSKVRRLVTNDKIPLAFREGLLSELTQEQRNEVFNLKENKDKEINHEF